MSTKRPSGRYSRATPKEYFRFLAEDFLAKAPPHLFERALVDDDYMAREFDRNVEGAELLLPGERPEVVRDYATQLVYESVASARWMLLGMPTVKMSALVAAEMAWAIPEPEVFEDARTPWRSFMIELPEGLFESVTHILVAWDGPGSVGHMFTSGSNVSEGSCYGISFKSFQKLFEKATMTVGPIVRSEAACHREFLHLKRLVVNVCIASTTAAKEGPSGSLSPECRPEPKRVLPGRAVRPSALHYVLRHPLIIEREAQEKKEILASFRNLLRTGRAEVGVRTWVHGHWRNQVCGPRVRDAEGVLRWTEHRRIFIASYMRGPDDSPLAVHPHIIV